MSIARKLTPPNHSFFLFGPRGTGKSTWLREHLSHALWKNLLLSEHYLQLNSDPSLLRKEVEALSAGSWVVIDEVQRIPALLNEVHDLIARFGNRYKFAMSGSSARKLKRLDVNLLAGRAIERKMFPLVFSELSSEWGLEKVLAYGSLPSVVSNSQYSKDILSTYVSTYLQQEIQQEALVEDISSFHRFLKILAIMNGEQLNASSVARDSGVARTTVDRYLDILVDTLIAVRIPGWQPRAKVKEQSAPRYYLFDCGVCRAITGRVYGAFSDLEAGKLLETYILHELRAAISYMNLGGELSYWRSASKQEIDFVWTRGDCAIGFEIKASSTWRREYGSAIRDLMGKRKLHSGYVVYTGESLTNEQGVSALSVSRFLQKLWNGEILVE